MSLVLNTNVDSLIAQNSLTTSGSSLSTALEQLSTGLRINSPADDAADYAIVQGMTSQINGMTQAEQNANDGVSLVQTASGAMQEVTNDLQSMYSLAVESVNATNSSTDRADLNTQFQQQLQDIDSVAANTQFNGVNLLDGSFQGATFQIGANEGQSIQVGNIADMHTSALGVYTGVSENDIAVGATGDSTIVVGGSGPGTGSFDLGTVEQDASLAATAINNAGVQGLSATANALSVTGTGAITTDAAGDSDVITINGVAVTALTNQGTLSTNVSNAVTAINGVSAETGVTATANGSGGISLSNTTGANITVGFASTEAGTGTAESALADYGLGGAGIAATNYSTYNISYTAAAGASGDLQISGALGTGSYAIGETGTAVSNLNVSSVDSANTAMTAITAALQQVASAGAQLGAYQDRFQSASTGLATDVTNLQSARSNVQDTDYAQATSQLSQAQILQQASTAMVAQANEIPQNVLTLLQKLP